jgi:hypothetical protein
MIPKEMLKLAGWFEEFREVDLNKLSNDKKNLLLVQALSIVYGMGLYEVGNKSKPDVPADRWEGAIPLSEAINIWKQEKKLESCQQHLRQFFGKYMQGIETIKIYAREWKPEFKNYLCFDQMQLSCKIRIETPLIKFEDPKVINKGEENEHALFRLNEEDLLNSTPRLAFRAETDEDTLLLYYYNVLELIILGAHKQCPECERYFIHLSKKAKTYCSNLCASKYKQREKRRQMKKSDPEAYQKYLTDESDRKRRELVKNTPYGKPKRNPYKYKDSKEP